MGDPDKENGATQPTLGRQSLSISDETSGFGVNVRLTEADLRRAVFQRVKEMADQKGRECPDLVDLLQKADVVFLDQRSNRVSFSRIIVTWDAS